MIDNSYWAMAHNTTFFSLPPQSAAVDINWNIVVCDGNATSIVVIPSQHTVLQLKELIEKKVNIPVSEQKAIYFQEKPLPDDRCLSDCEGMRNGSAVMVAKKPFTIHVYRNDVDITKTVEAPLIEVQSWSVGNLHDYILTKVGVPTYVPHILAVGEDIIDGNDHSHTVSQKLIVSGCHMTLTILQQVQYDKLDCVTQQSQVLSAPMSTSHSFMTSSVFHGKNVGTAVSDMHLQGAQAGLFSSLGPQQSIGAQAGLFSSLGPQQSTRAQADLFSSISLGPQQSIGAQAGLFSSLGPQQSTRAQADLFSSLGPQQSKGAQAGLFSSLGPQQSTGAQAGPFSSLGPQQSTGILSGPMGGCQLTGSWMGCLVLYIQKLDGSRVPIQLPDHSRTSVMSLREKVRDALKVPTYQQQLMLGETELEDWDEENEPLVLYNYPSMQNGSTIHLIVLTEGIHVKKGFSRLQVLKKVLPSRRNLCFDLKEEDFFFHPNYVNILNTKRLTLKQLKSRLNPDSWQTSSQTSSMGIGRPSMVIGYTSMPGIGPTIGIGPSVGTGFSMGNGSRKPVPKLCLNVNSLQGSQSPQHTVEITDAPVSTVSWITDGCALYLYNE